MNFKKLTENIFCIHTELQSSGLRFEGIWAIPTGVTINSYIIKGEKSALIDVVLDDERSIELYKTALEELGLSFQTIDFLILNHLEPDHTGFLTELLKINKNVQIYSTKKGIGMVQKFFKISDNLNIVKTGDMLNLGNSVTLKFFETPNVHWPETMMTYCEKDEVLFSCDCFGGYGILENKLFDDEHTTEELKKYDHEALRYYSNIMSSFSSFILKAIKTISQESIKILAPSHGIIWRKNPQHIIKKYTHFAEYNKENKYEKEICIIWGSMYGYTRQAVESVIEGIKSKGLNVILHQVPDEEASYILADAYKAAGLVIAMPTYEYKMFPPMAHILDLCERKHVTNKIVLRIGSWGWSGGAKKEYESQVEKLKWEHITPYEWQGIITDEDRAQLKLLGTTLAEKVFELE